MKTVIGVLLLTLSFSVLSNGNSNGGKIVHLGSINEILLFRVQGNSESNRPSCATTNRFAVHKDSVHAPLVMMAFANGRPLGNLRGHGTCTQHVNAEDIHWFEICPLNGCH